MHKLFPIMSAESNENQNLCRNGVSSLAVLGVEERSKCRYAAEELK